MDIETRLIRLEEFSVEAQQRLGRLEEFAIEGRQRLERLEEFAIEGRQRLERLEEAAGAALPSRRVNGWDGWRNSPSRRANG